MKNHVKIFSREASGGFTLVELIISLAISGIITGAIYSAYLVQQRSYLAQEQVAEMQQNLRAAMDKIVREIRMAGYDLTDTAGATITTASAGQIGFAHDLNADGDTADDGEMIDFGFSAADGKDTNRDGLPDTQGTALSLGRRTGGSGGYHSVAENIQAIEFRYLDSDGAATTTLENIRSVEVSILARAGQPDPNFTNTMTYTPASGTPWDLNGAAAGNAANDHYRRRLLITTIQCRNMGL